jgi:S1-C subfamily serine protease
LPFLDPAAPPTSAPPAVVAAPRRRSIAGVFALVLAILLAIVAGGEGYLLYRLDGRLDDANRRAAAERTSANGRVDKLDKRTSDLEKRVGSAFDSAAVAAAALPSVFRVSAGDFTGTAFAVGREVSGGGTYLFTNYHVIEQVWTGGKREVFLERRSQRFPATITKVDKDNDVALLVAREKFPRLATASEKVKAGQPIVVVGAPLGLEDSVTTGVVSAFRKLPDLSGEVIQFDAPINPGNSGGPVINSDKQVVGIASAKARDAEGIGLAIPIATACSVLAVC